MILCETSGHRVLDDFAEVGKIVEVRATGDFPDPRKIVEMGATADDGEKHTAD